MMPCRLLLSRRCATFAAALAVVMLAELFAGLAYAENRPNVVFILADDLGWGDLSCYGNTQASTPRIDQMAREGVRFHQFYAAAPVCSASRVAYLTGQHPLRHQIHSFLASRQDNKRRGMADWLDTAAPSIARQLKSAGYATAHVGKWHLGGGRDVGDAPLPKEYGFDESYTSFEGLGDRALITGDGLSEQSAELGQGEIDWAPKHELTARYVDKVVDFIRQADGKPFYVQLWLTDIHDPFDPTEDQLKKFEQLKANPYDQQYAAVLTAMDAEIGRLLDAIDGTSPENTIVIFASDNGPTAWPRYDKEGYDAPGSTGGLRGRKWSLYEGGIRSPLIVRWKGQTPAAQVDQTTVASALDFLPTLCRLAGAELPQEQLDGADLSDAFRGTPDSRERLLYWGMRRHEGEVQPARPLDRSPPLAVREGDWKLLAEADGSQPELYNLKESAREYANVAGLHPEVTGKLLEKLQSWAKSLPAAREGAAPETPAPTGGRMVTRWAGDLDAAKPLPEYPRPQLVRSRWLNLNGQWEFAIRRRQAKKPDEWDGRIVVPFPVESLLSDVQKRVGVDKRLWYRRTFELPKDWAEDRVILHFGAVDWRTTVWVNGKRIGVHAGGYDPFSFDVTDAIRDGGAQEIVLAVWDPTNAGSQPRGKQVRKPEGIWYTPVTGIWQTVWVEPVPKAHIKALKVTPEQDGQSATIDVRAEDADESHELVLSVNRADHPGERRQLEDKPIVAQAGEPLRFDAGDKALKWSPDSPWLYHGEIILRDKASVKTVDRVETYFALRTIERKADTAGIDRLFLNGKPLFMLGPLDQGWWPDGLYTAPTDAALRYDVEETKNLGFNMIRKHVKVEPARWYYWADRLGIVVWQDMPSAMQGEGRGENHVPRDGEDLDLADDQTAIFRRELKAMIDAFINHPSIVVWVPFNEGWGQHDTNEILEWVMEYDPTRLVDGPSGWTDRGVGDMLDIHKYPGPDMAPVTDGRASVLGEFGGLGLPINGHTWISKDNWGYRSYETANDLRAAYEDLFAKLPDLIRRGLAAAVYTQTTDVEIEVNGLMTYDRAMLKIDREWLLEHHESVIKTPTPDGE